MPTNNGFLMGSSTIQTNNTDVTLNNQSYTGFTFNGNCIIDSICIQNYGKSDTEVLNTSVSTLPDWTPSVIFLSSMNNTVDGSNVTGLINSPVSWSLYRKEVNGNELFKVCEVEPDVLSYIDYKAEAGGREYEWYLFANSETQISSPIVTSSFKPTFYGYYLIDSVDVDNYTNNDYVESYKLDLNIKSNQLTNNASVTFLQNFTKYDGVVMLPRNFISSSCTGTLIPINNGEYDFEQNLNWNDLADSFRAFLNNTQQKYLKLRSGKMYKVVTADVGSNNSTMNMKYTDEVEQQLLDVTFMWTEIAPNEDNNGSIT